MRSRFCPRWRKSGDIVYLTASVTKHLRSPRKNVRAIDNALFNIRACYKMDVIGHSARPNVAEPGGLDLYHRDHIGECEGAYKEREQCHYVRPGKRFHSLASLIREPPRSVTIMCS